MVVFPIGVEALLNRHCCGFFTILHDYRFMDFPRSSRGSTLQELSIMHSRILTRYQLWRLTRAQALVEMALILPLLLLLILGAVDFGRLFMTKFILTNAAREGANYIAYYFDKDNIAASQEAAKPVILAEGNSSGITIDPGKITFTGCCTAGQPVSVTVAHDVDLIFDGFLSTMGVIDLPVTISSTVTMVVQ